MKNKKYFVSLPFPKYKIKNLVNKQIEKKNVFMRLYKLFLNYFSFYS